VVNSDALVLAIAKVFVRLFVCLSACPPPHHRQTDGQTNVHTLLACQNGASYDHEIFNVGFPEDYNSRIGIDGLVVSDVEQ